MIDSVEQPSCDSAAKEQQERARRLTENMNQVARKLIVLSGKGGVGKSTVAANLAAALASNHRVGLLDVDIHGPSIPRLMGIEGTLAISDGTSVIPARVSDNLSVMSVGLLLRNPADAVVWRGPVKYSVIQQFLADVAWGPLDYLVIDCPPGTGDEPLAVTQLAGQPAAGIIVTTPQELAISDARRCVTFCRQVGLPIAGIVENMRGWACPDCRSLFQLFGQGGGEKLAAETGVPFLGAIPIDPAVARGGDSGTPFGAAGGSTPVERAFSGIIGRIEHSAPAGQHVCCGRHKKNSSEAGGCEHHESTPHSCPHS